MKLVESCSPLTKEKCDSLIVDMSLLEPVAYRCPSQNEVIEIVMMSNGGTFFATKQCKSCRELYQESKISFQKL